MSETLANFVMRRAVCLRPEDSLGHALEMLAAEPAQAVLVMEGDGTPLMALMPETLPRLWLEGVTLSTLLREVAGVKTCVQPASAAWHTAVVGLISQGPDRVLVVQDESGKLLGVLNEEDFCRQLGLQRIVDAQKLIESRRDSELRLQAVFNSTQVLLGVLEPDGTVLEINSVALDMVGARREDVVGKPFWETPGWQHDPQQQEKLRQAIQQCRQGETQAFEVTNKVADSSLLNVDFAARPIFDDEGKVRYILAEGCNVTARRQAENALGNERAVLRSVLDTIPDLIFFKDTNSVYQGCNRAFEKYFGKPQNQIVGRTDFYFVNAELADLFREKDQLAMQSGETCINEEWVRYPDGRRVLLETIKTPIRGAGGKIMGLLGVARDITERRRLDEELRKSQERYRRLFENMNSGFVLMQVVLDLAGKPIDARHVEVNPAYEQIVGKPAQELLGKTMREVYPDMESYWLEAGGRVAMTGESQVIEGYAAGLGRWLKVNLFCPQRGFFAGIVKDSSEQRRAEELLRRQKAQLRAILDNFPFLVWLKDREGRYLDANYRLARLYGQTTPEALVGKTDFDFCPPEKASYYVAEDREVMQTLVHKTVEAPVDDEGHWEEVFKTPILADDGALLGTAGFSRDITERKRSEAALRASQAHYQALLDASPFGVIELDAADNCVYANQRYLDMLGVTFEQVRGEGWKLDVHPRDKERVEEVRRQTIAEGVPGNIEYRRVLPGGRVVWVLGHGVPMRDAGGAISGAIVAILDITERKEAENQLKLAASIYEACGEGVMVLDTRMHIVSVNPAFTTLLGYESAEVLGRTPDVLASRRDLQSVHEQVWRAVEESGVWQGEIWGRRKDGSDIALWMTISTLRNRNGEVQWRFALFSDITDKKQAEELIWRQANYDSLTGLPNRRLFRDRLQIDIKKTRRAERTLALLFVDLDHFKNVNDTLGHDYGDRLLAEVAQRLQRCVRDSDTVARMGGDEFTVVLPEQVDDKRASEVAQAMLDALALPFDLDGEQVCISASVGIALFPRDGTEDRVLLKQADRAMYFAKAKGRNAYSFVTG
ncbi:PAS domain S-box-containing protein/diguanylate cyclase (GGDEF) domain-containing protein [Formivibrio citricus]|uniref:PAS domain S-box-containing protein/diguanylate cyclase (GGDEF) domain-containing protein n=1 Tax=Formivibrio citricus TaxID=83765 RepID=A0A1I4VX96_9NEIS|nr:PAS domain S-box protein [Formivibrio citricus]SFN05770.1 PAS domain S-box-containing protein/diguanylate cyclase (GGDEF) domain-containing protein [Formivibrio citricus]